MELYVVQPGDTLYGIAQSMGVPMSRLLADNRPPDPARLVEGQALVVRFPEEVYAVREGDTLRSVAQAHGLTPRALLRQNPSLEGQSQLYPGQTLVLHYRQEGGPPLLVNGYAYPFIDLDLYRSVLPFLTYAAPFTYGFHPDGSLVELEDETLLALAREMGTGALMHLSTLTDEGSFSNELAHLALTDLAVQDALVENVLRTIQEKGYQGLDVDFEFLPASDAAAYAGLIRRFRAALAPQGRPVIVAAAPKTYATQPGLLYEGHDYRALGEAADFVFLMTYEWGYTYGPPMAVAPLPNVRAVVEYALTEIPVEKLWLGIPSYGYDWPLPFRQGESRATSLSPQYAVELAGRYGVAIQYDARAQAPWFRYIDPEGIEHEVWFEDARSIRAKLELIPEYGLSGAGYWNLMRPFPQNWPLLDSLFTIQGLF